MLRCQKRIGLVLITALTLLFSACSTGPSDGPDDLQGDLDHGQQSPITLDSEYLQVAEDMPDFAGLFYDDAGELTVALAGEGLSAQALEAQRDVTREALSKVFGDDIFFTQPDKAQIDALGSDLSTQALAIPSEGFKLVRVKYSFANLAGWRKQVEGVAWTVDGVNALDIDEVNNRIFVGAEDGAAVAELQNKLAALGIPNDALVVEVEEAAEPLITLNDRYRPLVGGLGIVMQLGSQSGGCTYGFNAIRAGVRGFVTNAHCTFDEMNVRGTRIYQGGSLVGYEAAEAPLWTAGGYQNRWADVAFIRFNGNQSHRLGGIARTPLGSTEITGVNQIAYKSYNPLVGQVVYKVGRTTGTTRGRITRTCIDLRANGTNIVNKCQSSATSIDNRHIARAGDSGSPVYSWRYVRNVGWKVELKGINWGGNNGSGINSTMPFSPTRNIQYSLGTLRVHPYQKTGERMKVTLRYVKVHDDCEPWYKGDGDMYGWFNIEGSRVFTLPETDIASGENISINRYRTVTARYDNTINIRGIVKDADDTDADDWVGNWNLNLQPVPSVGYFSSYSAPDCSATLYYRIEDVGDSYE